MLSGGEGNVMLANILGNPGESGSVDVSGTPRVRLTKMLAGFLSCCVGDLEEPIFPRVLFGRE